MSQPQQQTSDYYATLGIAPEATPEEVRRAYRDQAQEAMADRERFERLSRAFETLKDPARRAAYDRRLRMGLPPEDDGDGPEKTNHTNAAAGTNMTSDTTQQRTAQISPDATVAMGGGSTMMGGTSAGNATMVVPPGAGLSIPLPTVCPMALNPCPLKNGTVLPDEGFCPECGFLLGSEMGAPLLRDRPMPKLIATDGREFPLKSGENVVGREGADVMLPDRSVSRRHARIVVEENGGVWVEDLGSTNGSRVAGEPVVVGKRIFLKDGTELRFGVVRLTIQVPSWAGGEVLALPMPKETGRQQTVAVAALAAPGGATASAAAARLESKNGPAFTLTDAVVTVGRKPENTLVISGDPYVSGSHARILFEGDAFRLIDVGSTNGTRLNGRKLPPHAPQTLAEGDEIVFGQTPYTFRAPARGG
jgi:DnaJ-class molecular chaperone with C-terminal Zn finger domain